MRAIAIKLLLGDRPKYLSLIFGVTFATLLMAQQVSIFIGLMARTASTIDGVTEADVWVMDPKTRYIEEIEPIRDIELSRVRSVPGVQWAVPFYKSLSVVHRPDGLAQQVQNIAVDRASLVGSCSKVVLGEPKAIQGPESVMIDRNGYLFMWPGQPLQLGKVIELNERRLVIRAICDGNPTFMTFPILYLNDQTFREITAPQRKKLSFVLVKTAAGLSPKQLADRIHAATGLQALTQSEFAWRSISYVLQHTGIPINFGITILLGIIIGIAITAQTFYIFVIEHLKPFACMRAFGFTNRQLLNMLWIQASLVAAIGYSLGIGLTALFLKITGQMPTFKGFVLHWQVAMGTACLIALIIIVAVLFSMKRVLNVDPAMAFRA